MLRFSSVGSYIGNLIRDLHSLTRAEMNSVSWEFSSGGREDFRVNHVGHCHLDVFGSPTSQ